MNTKEAIKILESNGCKVYDDGTPEQDIRFAWTSDARAKQRRNEIKNKVLYRVWHKGHTYGVYTGRELIDLAENWNNMGSFKPDEKRRTTAKKRSSFRNKIKTEKFDDIPPRDKRNSTREWYF